MNFITKRNSKTGKKFLEIEKRKTACWKAQQSMAKEFGFEQWRYGYWVVFGGISAVIFKNSDKVDKKIWRNVDGTSSEWMPRRNNVEGKAIHKRFMELPTVPIEDLNECIGFDGAPFKTIGFAWNSKTHFGFVTEEKWGVKVPKDCTEVTTTKYNSLFGKERE